MVRSTEMTSLQVHPEALMALKRQVLERHGKFRGVLTEEASRALVEYAERMARGDA